MICGYCRTRNSEEDHRCTRCGRRLHHAAPRPAPDTYPVVRGAAARALNTEQTEVAQTATDVARVEPPSGVVPAIQASLFGPQAVPRVLEMPVPRVEKRVQTAPRVTRRGDAAAGQQSLDLLPAQIETRSPDAVVQCAAPVAPLVLRALAAAVDTAIIACALGVLLGTMIAAGVDIVLRDKAVAGYYGAAACLVVLLYKGFFLLANADSIGVRALRMRVVNFDGHKPTAQQRLLRFGGGCISVLAATLGLLWSLVDEESLTWHDHISKTFPTATPVDSRR